MLPNASYNNINDKIVSIFLKYGYEDSEAYMDLDSLRSQISTFTCKKRCIECIIPAFPGKSINNNSVLSHKFDYGDFVAVKRLEKLAKEISEIYDPGCIIKVIHDGFLFSLAECVRDDAEMYEYINELRKATDAKYIQSICLTEIPNYKNFLSDCRESLCNKEKIRSCVLKTCDINYVSAEILFSLHEFNFLFKSISRRNLKQQNKEKAYKIIYLTKQLGDFLEKNFPDKIRLSIHKQTKVSKKIPIQLIPCSETTLTPWYHTTTITDDGKFILKKYKDVSSLPVVSIDGYDAIYMGS